jgi:hypothetical protein
MKPSVIDLVDRPISGSIQISPDSETAAQIRARFEGLPSHQKDRDCIANLSNTRIAILTTDFPVRYFLLELLDATTGEVLWWHARKGKIPDYVTTSRHILDGYTTTSKFLWAFSPEGRWLGFYEGEGGDNLIHFVDTQGDPVVDVETVKCPEGFHQAAALAIHPQKHGFVLGRQRGYDTTEILLGKSFNVESSHGNSRSWNIFPVRIDWSMCSLRLFYKLDGDNIFVVGETSNYGTHLYLRVFRVNTRSWQPISSICHEFSISSDNIDRVEKISVRDFLEVPPDSYLLVQLTNRDRDRVKGQRYKVLDCNSEQSFTLTIPGSEVPLFSNGALVKVSWIDEAISRYSPRTRDFHLVARFDTRSIRDGFEVKVIGYRDNKLATIDLAGRFRSVQTVVMIAEHEYNAG